MQSCKTRHWTSDLSVKNDLLRLPTPRPRPNAGMTGREVRKKLFDSFARTLSLSLSHRSVFSNNSDLVWTSASLHFPIHPFFFFLSIFLVNESTVRNENINFSNYYVAKTKHCWSVFVLRLGEGGGGRGGGSGGVVGPGAAEQLKQPRHGNQEPILRWWFSLLGPRSGEFDKTQQKENGQNAREEKFQVLLWESCSSSLLGLLFFLFMIFSLLWYFCS